MFKRFYRSFSSVVNAATAIAIALSNKIMQNAKCIITNAIKSSIMCDMFAVANFIHFIAYINRVSIFFKKKKLCPFLCHI